VPCTSNMAELSGELPPITVCAESDIPKKAIQSTKIAAVYFCKQKSIAVFIQKVIVRYCAPRDEISVMQFSEVKGKGV
jgi:hypothetical protein